MDENAIGEIGVPADLRVARDVGSHDRQKDFVRRAIIRYLQSQPRDEDGNLVLERFDQSDCWFTIRPAELQGDARRASWQNVRPAANWVPQRLFWTIH